MIDRKPQFDTIRLWSIFRTFVILGEAVSAVTLGCRQPERQDDSGGSSPPILQRRVESNQPLPPDLGQCTHLELQYCPSTLGNFFPITSNILSEEELEYVQSLKTIRVDDSAQIKAIADEIRSGHYAGHKIEGAAYTFDNPICFSCYRGEELVVRFVEWLDTIETNTDRFKYDKFLTSTRFVPEQIRPLVLRGSCAYNLLQVHCQIGIYHLDQHELPARSRWCDDLATVLNAHYNLKVDRLTCPSGGRGRCDYAMNTNWELNSPRDLVVLFEAKPGWNQCGGPELFTFDNHEPRGGCVVLNDAPIGTGERPTIKFIRTKEELAQLRWKP